MISVIIPLYNKEKDIQLTIESVLNQTFQEFEIVIVNDGSTDESVKVVQSFSDSRLRIINQSNQGVSAARNKGILEARYEYLAFLDADDEWLPNYLHNQVSLIERYKNCTVFGCAYQFKDVEGSVKNAILKKLPFKGEYGVLDNYFVVASCSHPPLCSSAIIVKKEEFQKIGGFPVGVTLGEDLITWAKLACYGHIAYSLNPLVIYNFRTPKQLVTPRKLPDVDNYVGKELEKLYKLTKENALKRYVARWYKMRFVTYVRLGMKKHAWCECRIMLKYNLFDFKAYYWIILNLLPHILKKNILYMIANRRNL